MIADLKPDTPLVHVVKGAMRTNIILLAGKIDHAALFALALGAALAKVLAEHRQHPSVSHKHSKKKQKKSKGSQ